MNKVVTIIRAIGDFIGWEAFLLGAMLSFMLSLLLYWFLNTNRSKSALGIFTLVQLAILEFCDTVWTFYFYPQGEYINHGIISVYALLLLPILYFVSTAVFTRAQKKMKDKP